MVVEQVIFKYISVILRFDKYKHETDFSHSFVVVLSLLIDSEKKLAYQTMTVNTANILSA